MNDYPTDAIYMQEIDDLREKWERRTGAAFVAGLILGFVACLLLVATLPG